MLEFEDDKSPLSDMSVDSIVTSDASESVVCISKESLSGIKPYRCGCGRPQVVKQSFLFVGDTNCSGLLLLLLSQLLDDMLCESGWGITLSCVLGLV